MDGFIKLPRSLLEWEWHSDPNTLSVYITLLLMAEFRDSRYRGFELKRGQIAITVDELSRRCGITPRQTRTVLERLKTTNKATIKSTSKFSIITLIEYDGNFENDKRMSNRRQTDDNQTTNQCQTNVKPTLYREEIKKNKNLRSKENALARYSSKSSIDMDEVMARIQERYRNGGDGCKPD